MKLSLIFGEFVSTLLILSRGISQIGLLYVALLNPNIWFLCENCISQNTVNKSIVKQESNSRL